MLLREVYWPLFCHSRPLPAILSPSLPSLGEWEVIHGLSLEISEWTEPKDRGTLYSHNHLTSLWNKSNKPCKNLTKILGILQKQVGGSLWWFHRSSQMGFQHGKHNPAWPPLGITYDSGSAWLAALARLVQRETSSFLLTHGEGSAGFPLCLLPHGTSDRGGGNLKTYHPRKRK